MPSSNAVRPSSSRDASRELVLIAPRIRDLDLAQPVLHAAVVIGEEDRPLAEELEDLVDRIAELEAAVFDADARARQSW